MRGKYGVFLGFTGIRLVSFITSAISFLVLVIIGMMIWNIWGPDPKPEVASKAFFDDIENNIRRLESGRFGNTLISSGTLDNGIWLISINADEQLRPRECGGYSNSCICLCRDYDDADGCKDVIKCKAFSSDRITHIDIPKLEGESLTVELKLHDKRITI